MYSPFHIARKYLGYWLTAANHKGHGTHSPFVFDFITRVLNDRGGEAAFYPVEELRTAMRKDPRVLSVTDLGAGSVTRASKNRSVSAIARHAAKPKKYAQLLYRTIRHYQLGPIVELGTSLGLTTSYLAAADPGTAVYTIEGAPEIAGVARQNFERLGLKNIHLLEGDFDQVLPGLLGQIREVGMVFIDGNHRKEPTLNYFRRCRPYLAAQSVIVFDDIHWSREMEAAWQEVKDQPEVMLTIDLFFIGLVFFNPAFRVKQHFKIRF